MIPDLAHRDRQLSFGWRKIKAFEVKRPYCYRSSLSPVIQLKGLLNPKDINEAEIGLFLKMSPEGSSRTELKYIPGYTRQQINLNSVRAGNKFSYHEDLTFIAPDESKLRLLVGLIVNDRVVMRGGLEPSTVQVARPYSVNSASYLCIARGDLNFNFS